MKEAADSMVLGFVDTDSSFSGDHLKLMPSKVGGKPKWLSLAGIPDRQQLACGECGDAMPLLLQIYAPFDHLAHAYHRSVFVFCCKRVQCHKHSSSKPFKVFRSNLPRINPFYSEDKAIDTENTSHSSEDALLLSEFGVNLCEVCSCSIKEGRFCDNNHKIVSNVEAASKGPRGKPLFSFPTFEIVVEEVPLDSNGNPKPRHTPHDDDYSVEMKLLKEYEKKERIFSEEDDNQLDELAENLLENAFKYDDKAFKKFNKAMQDRPDQILRYWPNGNPLVASRLPLPNVSNCLRCHTPLHFEFQIMPQILNHILSNRPGLNPVEHLDWATLLIYSCPNSCHPSDDWLSVNGYVEELLVKQDYD